MHGKYFAKRQFNTLRPPRIPCAWKRLRKDVGPVRLNWPWMDFHVFPGVAGARVIE
jgi:hypothetical protein